MPSGSSDAEPLSTSWLPDASMSSRAIGTRF
jgi:hypothetical protein